MPSPDSIMLRWRKRTRTRLLIALVFALLVTIFAGPIIGLVVLVIQAIPSVIGYLIVRRRVLNPNQD